MKIARITTMVAAVFLVHTAAIGCSKKTTPDSLENTKWIATNVSFLGRNYPILLITFKADNDYEGLLIKGKYDYQKPKLTLSSDFGEFTGTIDGDAIFLTTPFGIWLLNKTK